MIAEDLTAWLADVDTRAKPATRKFYRGRSKWIRETLGARELLGLASREVLAALDRANRWPDSRMKAPDTLRANAITWEQFQKWAIETGRLESPVTKPIKKPGGRQREQLPTRQQIEALLAAGTPAFGRIYQTLLLTGARPDELCRATIGDYRPADQVIVLDDHKTKGKTGRARAIPLNDAAAAFVREAVGDRQAGPIFLDDRGAGWSRERLSRRFRMLRDQLQIDRSIVLYCTRHKAATELCHAAGIEAAAAVLGHAGLQTIRRYVHHETAQLVKYAQSAAVALSMPPPDPSKLEITE